MHSYFHKFILNGTPGSHVSKPLMSKYMKFSLSVNHKGLFTGEFVAIRGIVKNNKVIRKCLTNPVFTYNPKIYINTEVYTQKMFLIHVKTLF